MKIETIKTSDDKNTGKSTDKDKRLKNLKPWKKGDPSPNPSGRPLGQRNFATIYKEALIKLAEKNDKTPDELENEILSKGILNARTGDYRFYKDLLDRLHGTATQKSEVDVHLPKPITQLFNNGVQRSNSDKEDSSTEE